MVWCGVVWCGVVWCGVVWCGVVWCGVVWCGCGCGCGESGVLYQLETPFDEGYRSLTQDELDHEGLTLIITIPYRVVAVVEVCLQFVVLQMLIKAGRLDSAILCPFLFSFRFLFFFFSLSFIRGVLGIRSLSEASFKQFVGHFKLAACEGQEDDVLVDEEQSRAYEFAT